MLSQAIVSFSWGSCWLELNQVKKTAVNLISLPVGVIFLVLMIHFAVMHCKQTISITQQQQKSRAIWHKKQHGHGFAARLIYSVKKGSQGGKMASNWHLPGQTEEKRKRDLDGPSDSCLGVKVTSIGWPNMCHHFVTTILSRWNDALVDTTFLAFLSYLMLS